MVERQPSAQRGEPTLGYPGLYPPLYTRGHPPKLYPPLYTRGYPPGYIPPLYTRDTYPGMYTTVIHRGYPPGHVHHCYTHGDTHPGIYITRFTGWQFPRSLAACSCSFCSKLINLTVRRCSESEKKGEMRDPRGVKTPLKAGRCVASSLSSGVDFRTGNVVLSHPGLYSGVRS